MWHFQSTNTRKRERLQERGSREVFRETPINISNTRKSVSSGFETSGLKKQGAAYLKKKKKKKNSFSYMEIQFHTQSPKAVWTVVGLERP